MHRPALLPLLGLLLVSACGEQTVHSACYKNGDHANMSDGRITRICDCVDAEVKRQNPTPRQSQIVVAWFNGKTVDSNTPRDRQEADVIVAAMKKFKASCEAIR